MSAMPTAGMREEAQRYRDWKAEGRKGGTEVAARRATQILSGDELSDDTIITMAAWFARHEVDKQAEGFSPGEDGYPSPGRVAWAAWGGDPGKSWADSLVSKMDRIMDQQRPYPMEHAARLRDPAQYDEFRRKNNAGGEGVDFIYGIKDDRAELQAIRFRIEQFTAEQARQWLVEHDHTAIEFEEATGERQLMKDDYVSWTWNDKAYIGRVVKVMSEGMASIEIEDGEAEAELSQAATPADPVAVVVVLEDAIGGYMESDKTMLLSESTLTKVDAPIMQDDRAKPDELREGDFVSWNSSGGMARGRIEHIMREGTLGVPDSEFSINASADDPAALIRIYRQDSEGKWAETETLVGHRFSTLNKIDALRAADGCRYQRSEVTQFHAVDDRVMEFPFSSEYPIQRYFGKEVLSHAMDAAVLERLNAGAPLLFNHDPDRVLGVVERAWIDGVKKRGYAKVRFSRNKAAQEVLSDVRDGILRGVSFGYAIDQMEERDGAMVATSWQPYEISVVSIPADPSIGIGRSLALPTIEASTIAADAASPIMDAPAPEMEVIRSEAAKAERDRIAAITALGEKHNMADLARELIAGDKSLAEAREAVLDKLGQTAMTQPIRSEDITRNDIGLSKAETKRFSFVRALNYLANPGDATARRSAEFEIEVGRAAAAQYERASNGIVVPNEVLRRDLTVDIPTAGGNLVPDELLAGSFIDLLRNRLALAQAGVTMLSGLQGNIAIPRQTSAATAYWVGENVAPTESQQAIDQVNMTPKTVAAFVDYSRRLLLQSSIDVEGMIRNDLARVIALEIDRAALYGTGSSNQPLGLSLTPSIGTETYAASFTGFVAMETDVAVANADVASMYYIVNATTRGALKGTAKNASAVAAGFVFEDGQINGYPAIVSNQVSTSQAFFGDFSQMVMGMWSGLDLMVDPYAGATAGTVRVIAHQDLDVAVKQPGAFCFAS